MLGIAGRKRLQALAGLGTVAADVTIAELGGVKAMNEARPSASASPQL